MSDVVDFPGSTKGNIDPDKVAEDAKELDSFIVIGWRDSDFVMLNTDNDGPGVLFLLELARRSVMDMFMNAGIDP
jgi:hypothetical protein